MKRVVLFTAAAVMLAGCADEAAEFGRPVPVHLRTLRREVAAPPASGSNAAWLRRQAGVIAAGDLQAVHAEIVAASQPQAESLRGALIQAGIDPVRITASARISPSRRRAAIVFTRTVADTGDCRASIGFAFPDDPSRSVMSLGHCLKTNDLANMVVDPADLVAPPNLGRGDGANLANAVRSWRTPQNGSSAPASAASTSTTAPSSSSTTTAGSSSTTASH
jgi:type IV pilus biogenesis protein CpaD/CtpE